MCADVPNAKQILLRLELVSKPSCCIILLCGRVSASREFKYFETFVIFMVRKQTGRS